MAINQPEFIEVKAKDFLENEYFIDDFDEVLIFQPADTNIIYVLPVGLLEKREIINMHAYGYDVSINYCPLTGTAYAWNTTLEEDNFYAGLFGVSGLLYNNNLVAFTNDGSLWSQVLGKCIKGPLLHRKVEKLPLIKTNLGNALRISFTIHLYKLPRAFPEDAYLGYLSTDDNLPFVLEHTSDLLPNKKEVFAVELSDRVVVFELEGE